MQRHEYWCAQRMEGPPIIFCCRCGAFAGGKARKLLQSCEGAAASTHLQWKRYLSKGKDPRNNKPLVGKPWPLLEGAPSWWALAMAQAEEKLEDGPPAEEEVQGPNEQASLFPGSILEDRWPGPGGLDDSDAESVGQSSDSVEGC